MIECRENRLRRLSVSVRSDAEEPFRRCATIGTFWKFVSCQGSNVTSCWPSPFLVSRVTVAIKPMLNN